MESRNIFKPVFISVLFILSFLMINPVSAGTYVYTYRYWTNPDAIDTDECGTDEGGLGGTAEVRYLDLDDLGLFCESGGVPQHAQAWIFIDGGLEGVDPWTFSTRSYYWKVYWNISGDYEHASGETSFEFIYELYYMSGSTKTVVSSYTYEYDDDFDYEDQTVTHGPASAVSLDSSEDYYLSCKIDLYVGWVSADSDMYYGSNEINFEKVEFKYWSPRDP